MNKSNICKKKSLNSKPCWNLKQLDLHPGIHSKVGLPDGTQQCWTWNSRGPWSPSTAATKNIFRWKSPYKINRNHTKSTWLLYMNQHSFKATFGFTVTHIILIAVRVTLAIFNLPMPTPFKYSIRRLGDTMRDQKKYVILCDPRAPFHPFQLSNFTSIGQALHHQVKSRQQLLWQHVVEGIDGDLSEGAFYGCFRE